MNEVSASAAAAVADIPDGASLAVGGFGLSGKTAPGVTAEAITAVTAAKLHTATRVTPPADH
ncbi:hypothetical protein GCM10022232_14100 [Streptomyces plumbiresistens]|uniref:Coenzyme A transferase n=1 Tax=Streptomyces plumbiresistens TaxID=511811 RepID=A0ABP7QKX0_9ACTN